MVKVYKRVYDDPNYAWTEGTTIIRKSLEDGINEALEYALKNCCDYEMASKDGKLVST